jgi:hypothetical protein
MPLDTDDLRRRLSFALRSLAGADIPAVIAAADAKAFAITRYVALIADAWTEGKLTDDDMRREMDEIERMTRSYAAGLKGVAGGTAELAARRALAVVFGALRAGLSFQGAPLSEPLARRIETRLAA